MRYPPGAGKRFPLDWGLILRNPFWGPQVQVYFKAKEVSFFTCMFPSTYSGIKGHMKDENQWC